MSAPAVGGFIGMRLIGLVAGLGYSSFLYPDVGSAALETAVAQASTAMTVTPADFADDFAPGMTTNGSARRRVQVLTGQGNSIVPVSMTPKATMTSFRWLC